MTWMLLVLGVVCVPLAVLCIADLRHDRDPLSVVIMGVMVLVAVEPWVLWLVLS